MSELFFCKQCYQYSHSNFCPIHGTLNQRIAVLKPIRKSRLSFLRKRIVKTLPIPIWLGMLLIGTVVSAVILSNILTLGPYTTTGATTIIISQVTAPRALPSHPVNTTMDSAYQYYAIELPSGSGFVIPAV